jgi:hypothetical protein
MSELKIEQYTPSLRRRLRESSVGEMIWGTPKSKIELKQTKVMVLGAVEQSYGIYQVPTFEQQVNTLWNDAVVKEAITMFAEQVVATGTYFSSNKDYNVKLGGKTALDIIKKWWKDNHLDTKLLEIVIEYRAFGNSFWKVDDFGFTKVAIESVWHAVRVEPDEPLQEKYNLQLTPIYGGKVIPWEQFAHFRTGITGYHAPLGQGVIYSLLAKPVDSAGNTAPSTYDVRLSHRRSLDQGMKNFSFGNVWIGFPNMSNEDFRAQDANGQTIADKAANMSPTGNRILTNTDVKVALEVPERTQSYESFINDQRNEFFMALADPSIKLGIEEGFTKATAETASAFYKFKVSNSRRDLKMVFEDLFEQILNKLGYDGDKADIQLNFGPEEAADYVIADLFGATDRKIISLSTCRAILTKFRKWEIPANEESLLKEEADELMKMQTALAQVTATAPQGKGGSGIATAATTPTKPATLSQQLSEEVKEPRATAAQAVESEISPTVPIKPVIRITQLAKDVAAFNKDGTVIYIDPELSEKYYALVIGRKEYEYSVLMQGFTGQRTKAVGLNYERMLAGQLGLDYGKYNECLMEAQARIQARGSKDPPDIFEKEGY